MKIVKHYEIIRFSLISFCNLSCFYCNNEGQPINNGQKYINLNGLSVDILNKLLKILKIAGVNGVVITGGEPLLNPNWKDYLYSVVDIFHPSNIHLTTNGTINRKSDISFLSSIKIARVNVSLDTVDRNKYKNLTRYNQKLCLED